MGAYFEKKSGMSSDFKKILTNYWEGVDTGSQEIVGGDITYGLTVGRLALKGNGVDAALAEIRGLGTNDMFCSFDVVLADFDNQGLVGNTYYGGGAERWGVFIYNNKFYFNTQLDTASTHYRMRNIDIGPAGAPLVVGKLHHIEYNMVRGSIITVSIDGSVVLTASLSGDESLNVNFVNAFMILGYGKGSSSAGYPPEGPHPGLSSTAQIMNIVLKFGAATVLDAPLEGNTYNTVDVAYSLHNPGNALTNSFVYDRTDGVHSGLFEHGFDYYLDTATLTEAYYVPYKNGSPIVFSVPGFSNISSHPPAGTDNNRAPAVILMPEALMSGILDRGDTGVWGPELRSTSFNAAHPFEYLLEDLRVRNVMGSVLDAQKNKIFECDDDTAFMLDGNGDPVIDGVTGRLSLLYDGSMTRAANLLFYLPERSAAEMQDIAKYLIKKCGNDHLPWILTTGYWDDSGIWIDAASWTD